MLIFLIIILSKEDYIMVGNSCLSYSHIDFNNEYSLLTKEKIDEISRRISKDASDLLFKQLEDNIKIKKTKNQRENIKNDD